VRSVLVIDDDHNIRVVIRQALETYGYTVHSATNGRDALELLKKIENPDVILLDLMMPFMSGWEFIKEQKKIPALAKIPVVIVSAAEAVEGTILPAQGLIKKPFELETLLKTVEGYWLEQFKTNSAAHL